VTHTVEKVEGHCEICEHDKLKLKLYGENRPETNTHVEIECERCGEWLNISYVEPTHQSRVNRLREAFEE
jgi:hypothetical protein